MLVLLLFVNALFAQEKMFAQNEFLYPRTSVCPAPSPSVDVMGTSPASMFVVQPEENSGQNMIHAAAGAPTGDHGIHHDGQRSGTATFIVGAIVAVMLVTVPVQRFINAYSSYDSGENQYSHPAVHIQPNISRGSAWVSVQLRF
jgi:hypothetical protein